MWAVALAAAAAPACDVTRPAKEVCADFCSYKCGFYNASSETGRPQNVTLIRLTPRNVTGIRNKDTGDALGDLQFYLMQKNLTQECAQDPDGHGCFLSGRDIFGVFQVEVDGQYGPYSMCNPLQVGGKDPVQKPDWYDSRDFRCAPGCFTPTAKDGCKSEWWPPKNGSGFEGYDCTCDSSERELKAVGRAPAPGGGSSPWDHTPKSWAPQCHDGYEPKCLTGTKLRTIEAWSYDSALALACDQCSRDPKCRGWQTLDNRTVTLFSHVLPRPRRAWCAGGAKTKDNRGPSWYQAVPSGGLWYSTQLGSECPPGRPLGTKGCTWRVVASHYANATCVNSRVDAVVEAHGHTCITGCGVLNRTSDCYLDCYRATLMGDAGKNLTKVPPERLRAAFAEGTAPEAAGGCPSITPGKCDDAAGQCAPVDAPSAAAEADEALVV